MNVYTKLQTIQLCSIDVLLATIFFCVGDVDVFIHLLVTIQLCSIQLCSKVECNRIKLVCIARFVCAKSQIWRVGGCAKSRTWRAQGLMITVSLQCL